MSAERHAAGADRPKVLRFPVSIQFDVKAVDKLTGTRRHRRHGRSWTNCAVSLDREVGSSDVRVENRIKSRRRSGVDRLQYRDGRRRAGGNVRLGGTRTIVYVDKGRVRNLSLRLGLRRLGLRNRRKRLVGRRERRRVERNRLHRLNLARATSRRIDVDFLLRRQRVVSHGSGARRQDLFHFAVQLVSDIRDESRS